MEGMPQRREKEQYKDAPWVPPEAANDSSITSEVTLETLHAELTDLKAQRAPFLDEFKKELGILKKEVSHMTDNEKETVRNYTKSPLALEIHTLTEKILATEKAIIEKRKSSH